MKKVLIITYYWPPSGGSGVQRWLKFAQYLPEYGIEPIVLTVNPGKASYPVIDESLITDVPEGMKVYYSNIIDANNIYAKLFKQKVPYGSISKKKKPSLAGRISTFIRSNVFIPDSRMLWHWHAKPKALKIIREHAIDTIITTGPPQSTHLAGLKIKQATNVKWLVDFRDPWTKSFVNDFLSRTDFAEKRDRRLEQQVIAAADEIVLVSPGMKNDFSVELPHFNTIYNGYDEKDFNAVTTNPNPGKFSINYIGTFKDNQYIPALWEALEEICREENSFSADLEINFAGIVNPLLRQQSETFSYKNSIRYIGYVNHQKAIEYMTNASLLLFPIPQSQYSKNIITGKIFEYLASQTPLLAIGPPDGIAANIIADCERSPMLDYHNKPAIKQQIIDEYRLWKTAGNRKISNTKHQKYSRKNQTKILAERLKSL